MPLKEVSYGIMLSLTGEMVVMSLTILSLALPLLPNHHGISIIGYLTINCLFCLCVAVLQLLRFMLWTLLARMPRQLISRCLDGVS